ncbi:hypothetical protein BURMUCGD2M_0789 [Burkholderia multivorans CGD2M]|uniref:Uncharacterized protein n=1 Tax=Burkholderia multivorans CGD2 TaxID=513052 RepID=B9BTX0_9BURK|nr:hypothetical protein BURMUCGD2_0698 [Burkholderia multivorans CGD2]EEE12692.1 hypothetical protein BURMUCGD2M_0789 [Burkholderia multivorans CGD2M]
MEPPRTTLRTARPRRFVMVVDCRRFGSRLYATRREPAATRNRPLQRRT